MFRKQYHHLNEQVKPDKDLIQNTIERFEKYEIKHKNKVSVYRKPTMVLVSICLCLFFAMPVLAATVEPIYQIMYMVSPTVAQFFMPVQKSDENNGIKMEVVSAYIHDNVVEIYVTMQDLTGNRIDETTDLFDSYFINRPFDSSAHCERVGYDEITNTVTFLIAIEEWGNKNISGDKITFAVREFLSHKEYYSDLLIPINLSLVSLAEETQLISSNGGGGIDNQMFVDFENDPIALVPSSPMAEFSVDGINLTGIGYIDGKLHIQTAVENPLANDNHGYFYLKDSNGKEINCNYNFYFSNHYEEKGRIDYCNYVFDVSQDELAGYTLHGDFVTSGMKTEGYWRVVFPLEKK